MKCVKCNKKAKEHSNYCKSCHFTFIEYPAIMSYRTKEEGKEVELGMVLFLCLIAMFIIFIQM